MKLRELLNRAVSPRLHERFGTIVIDVEEFDEEEFEADELSISSDDKLSLSGLGLILDYEDTKGKRSQRIVTCREFAVQGGVNYLKAFCHHRNALRTFRIDRVVDIFDPTSGESLSPVHAFFSQFSPDRVTKSGLHWGMSVARRADLIAMLNALIFIARCDREFHATERSCLERALTSFWLRLEISGDPDFDDMLAYADRLAPDGEIFWLAMERFSQEPILAELFKRHAQLLIEADGVVRQEEAYWALEIEEYLSEA